LYFPRFAGLEYLSYQIPRTSKRVDFMIAGADASNRSNVVVVEMK
jgi:hypothetical protein